MPSFWFCRKFLLGPLSGLRQNYLLFPPARFAQDSNISSTNFIEGVSHRRYAFLGEARFLGPPIIRRGKENASRIISKGKK
jgi:hypothetical protein